VFSGEVLSDLKLGGQARKGKTERKGEVREGQEKGRKVSKALRAQRVFNREMKNTNPHGSKKKNNSGFSRAGGRNEEKGGSEKSLAGPVWRVDDSTMHAIGESIGSEGEKTLN